MPSTGRVGLRQERVHTQTVRRHRDVAGQDRHSGRAAASPQHSCVLQLATDECHRSIHSVQDGMISEDGEVSDDATREFLQNYMAEFHGFIARVYTALPRNPSDVWAATCPDVRYTS